MIKLTPEELIYIITLLIVSLILSITIVNLIIKCHNEDIFKYEHNKINKVIKETKRKIDKMNRKCKK